MVADEQAGKLTEIADDAIEETTETVGAAEEAEAFDEEYFESEVIELEIDEDDILYYITDQDDNEIGFAIMEDGKEVEYYYVDEEIDVAAEGDAAAASANADAESAEAPAAGKTDAKGGEDSDPLFTAEEISEFKDDMVGLLKDGASLAKELKSTYDEFSDVLDFLPIKKKHR